MMSKTDRAYDIPQRLGVDQFFHNLVLAMAVSMLIILGATGYGIFRVYQDRIAENAETDAINIVQFLVAENQDLLFASGSPERSRLLIGPEQQQALEKHLRRVLPNFQIVKIKIYDDEKRIMYSTEHKLIGKIDTNNVRLLKALGGQVDSHLENKALVRDLKDEERLDVDVVETYVPIRFDGKVAGVFEIYRDVTPYRQQIYATMANSVTILGIILLVVYGTFFMFIRRTTRHLAEAQERLREMATTDSLTGALNHGTIIARAQEEISRFIRRHERQPDASLSVILLDVDHFKKFNDTHGHLAGDQALRELCLRIRASLRDYDLLGRFGGEEFLIVLPDAPLFGAVDIAERIRTSVAGKPCHFNDQDMALTVSLGVAAAKVEGDGLTQVLQRADDNLYRAKEQGRNRVVPPPRPGEA